MKTKKSTRITVIVAVVLGIAALISVGCQSNAPNDKPSAASPVAEKPKDGQLTAYRDSQGRLICPVMGTVIASEDKAFDSYDHNGVRYYFCCGSCPDQFKANPDKFIKDKPVQPPNQHEGHDH